VLYEGMEDKLTVEKISKKMILDNSPKAAAGLVPIDKMEGHKSQINNLHEERFKTINKSPLNLSHLKRVV
jgi:hypothetical protein